MLSEPICKIKTHKIILNLVYCIVMNQEQIKTLLNKISSEASLSTDYISCKIY